MFRVVFWDILIPDDGGSTHLWNVSRQSFYTAVYPRRQLWTTNHSVSVRSSFVTARISTYCKQVPAVSVYKQRQIYKHGGSRNLISGKLLSCALSLDPLKINITYLPKNSERSSVVPNWWWWGGGCVQTLHNSEGEIHYEKQRLWIQLPGRICALWQQHWLESSRKTNAYNT
jgi:hypothetical protein